MLMRKILLLLLIISNTLVAQDTLKISTTAIDAGAPYTNLGSMESTGFDLSVNYSDATSSGMNYSIGAEITKASNEVTELISEFYTGGGTRIGAITRTSVGEPISYFYGRNVVGIFESAADIAKKDQGIEMRGIVTCIRHNGPTLAKKAAICAAETASNFVVGFGMGGDEQVGSPADFKFSFDIFISNKPHKKD